ncbi:MAG: hypothetical protein E4H44_01325 [Candidatus Aminicenantes bacterium]|nr:MAG: hypothetical protein E4H44_01325 [Candidatus Aminicenantes bacterium]
MSVKINVKADMTGAMAKSAILREMPAAFIKNANAWGADTVRFIQQSYKGGNVFKRPPKEIDQNLGDTYKETGPMAGIITLGTGGYVGKSPVVYARIQDEGGTIHAKKKFLTIPFPGVRGIAANFPDSFIVKSKKGNLIIAQKNGKGIKPLFLLRNQVTLPARRWFTNPIDARRPVLDEMMGPDAIWARAEKLANKHATMGA